jgi:hypothetical protein
MEGRLFQSGNYQNFPLTLKKTPPQIFTSLKKTPPNSLLFGKKTPPNFPSLKKALINLPLFEKEGLGEIL